ncbi:MAG: Rne/Rng family ribonuclease [Thermoanaerobaculia bacterium]
MSSVLLIESDPHRERAALLEDGRVVEILIEPRVHQAGVVGNIFKGRVARVVPGIQAAFVDIGLERNAFLYAGDVHEELESLGLQGTPPSGPQAAEQKPIEELLSAGQELFVQAVKDPLPNKGTRVTTHITLPGRLLVLLPTVSKVGISRRIDDEAERQRLEELLTQHLPASCGVIVRTAGAGREAEDFTRELERLCAEWQDLTEKSRSMSPPALVHREEDLAIRVVRDLLETHFEAIWVSGAGTAERVVGFLSAWEPDLVEKVRVFDEPVGLFERFGVEDEIEATLRHKVWLKSGGHISIHPTEALVAIDVNTGRFVGEQDLEATVLQTNLEAAREVAHQIRLRDLSGILVVDFIDMEEPENRAAVLSAFERELERDRAKSQVLGISEFGLVQITRKRGRQNLERLMTQGCPYCRSRGRIKSLSAICLDLRRDLLRGRSGFEGAPLVVRVHPEIGQALEGAESGVLEEIQETLNTKIVVEQDAHLHHEVFEIEKG